MTTVPPETRRMDSSGGPGGDESAWLHPVALLLGANLVGAAAGGVFFLVASWSFDLAGMGGYGLAISVHWVAVGLVGTGLSVATIRLVTDRIGAGDRPAAAGVVALAAVLAVAGCGALAVAGFLLGSSGATGPLLPGRVLALALTWAAARSTMDCLRSGLLARREYGRAAVLMLASAATGLVSLGIALASGSLTLTLLLAAHTAGLTGGALAGLLLLRPLWAAGVALRPGDTAALVRYARWPSLSEGSRLLQANVGPFVLALVSTPAAVGLFSVGRYPAQLFEIVAVSLYQYWLPEAARETTPERLRAFLQRHMRVAAAVGALMALGGLAGSPLMRLLGENFAAAAPLLFLNTVDFALFLLVRPIESVFHALHRPQLEMWLRVARIPVLVLLALPLATHHGAVGMVWAHVLTGLFGLLLAAWVVRGRIRGPLSRG